MRLARAVSNAELARAAFVMPQTMQAILVNLERGGLIARSPHPEHGRVIMTELTKAGQRVVAEGAKAADVVERQMLSRLSAEEARVLCELLKRCAAALNGEPSDS
jgi:DNA-binding MarR family transcriptional regulator